MFPFLKNDRYHAPDLILFFCFTILIIFGLFVLSSAGAATGFQNFGDSYYFIKHQLLNGLLPGLILFCFLVNINYQVWKKFTLPLLLISIASLVIVFIPGIGSTYGTAHSWINIFGFSFQPAELVKLTFLLYLATWLEKRGVQGVKDLYFGFLPFLFVLGIISILMLLQPDMGSLSIIIFLAMAVFFASGAKFKHVAMIVVGGGISIYFLITQSAYKLARLTTFLHPELDPQGIGYHINQAFLAIGSGGFWGRGFGLSRQKFQYLPEATGDSIFAILAEELGFIVCVLTIALLIFIVWRSLKIAKNSPDQFGRLVVIGIISWFTFQAFFNIASMVGLLPMTGIPLPFISYGGSALAISMGAVGILLNISRQTKKTSS
ncbi:MAG: Stage V sporulation protein e [Parcubacteria group bacterium GW2011_GWC2_39_14]|nr:MAG: Stage V sporulation protein e [Parcubacteria group bacterium GW2011_GWC2_39_14]KKR54495.1 MAG: Stage V sporulation protein e [Parcubacteria group bacterium GW2011_GWA2_40_23]